MQVLGDLVQLPTTPGPLPLPWWHRAPLGLQSDTWCYVSLMPSVHRPVGDLVVSVLDPAKWPKTMAVQSRQADRPGVVSAAIDAARDTNIALAETVTMESGAEHEVTLICEAAGDPKPKVLESRLVEGGFRVDASRTYPQRNPVWTRRVEIQAGWIHQPDWQDEVLKLFGNNDGFERVDLSMAVVSADTGNRLLRFVFPRKEARTISVEHRDTPGAMRQVTEVLFQNGLNVLSLLLRRGGAKAGNAILIAACEPTGEEKSTDVYDNVQAEIDSLPSELMAEIEIRTGIRAEQSITPREPGTIVSRVPKSIGQRVREERHEIPSGKWPVFFSRRFVDDRRPRSLAGEVRAALKKNGCHPLEASPEEHVLEPAFIFLEVSAKMWVAEAGVVLVTNLEDTDALGKNLPYEFGYLLGQTKPILLLVEEGSSDSLKTWSNIEGVYAPRFASGYKSLDRESKDSIYGLVSEWAVRLRR